MARFFASKFFLTPQGFHDNLFISKITDLLSRDLSGFNGKVKTKRILFLVKSRVNCSGL
jgi:hypothetical protein